MKKEDAPCIEDLTEIIRGSFHPQPVVTHLNSAANISDYLKPRLQTFPSGIMKYRQFRLELRAGHPVFSVRTKARGSEIFRGIADSTLYTPCWDAHIHEGIDYEAIPAAKRKLYKTRQGQRLPFEHDIEKYKTTILTAQRQWGLKMYQLDSLVEMLQTLASTEPIPFHWIEENLLFPPPEEPIPASLSSASEDDADSKFEHLEEEDEFNVWDNAQKAMHAQDPLLPFQLGDLVCINSGGTADSDEPFFLARIVSVSNPPAWNSKEGKKAGATAANDWLVKVSWYDQVNAKKRVHWQKAKWKEQKDCVEWILKRNIYQALDDGLTSAGLIRHKHHRDILFYLDNPSLAISERSESDAESDSESEGDQGIEAYSSNPTFERLSPGPVTCTVDGVEITESTFPPEDGYRTVTEEEDKKEEVSRVGSNGKGASSIPRRTGNKSGGVRTRLRAAQQLRASRQLQSRRTSFTAMSSSVRSTVAQSIFDSQDGLEFLAAERKKQSNN